MQIELPETDLKLVQTIDSVELRDATGRAAGKYIFGKGHGRTVIPFGKYRRSFKTRAECQAFVNGVLAVINHQSSSIGPRSAAL